VRRSITITITAFILGLLISAAIAQPQITEQAIQNIVFNSTASAFRTSLYNTNGGSIATPGNNSGLGIVAIAYPGDSTNELNSSTLSASAATVIKASPGTVFSVQVLNTNASVCYLQFLNTAVTPALGTSVIYSLGLPASGSLSHSFADIGVFHSVGISVGATTARGGAVACTTALDFNIFYK
jgi:hypothetical protein